MASKAKEKAVAVVGAFSEIESPAYKKMQRFWPMISVLMEGTSAIRAAGETFLPKNTAETQKNYDNRLATAILTPFYSTNVTKMAGKAFTRKPTISEEMDPRIKEFCEDIDLQGNDIAAFASDVFVDIMAYGMGWILVDFPNVSPEETRTVAEEKASGARPYWNYLHVSQVPFVLRDKITKRILEAHIIEYVEERKDGSIEIVKQFRVLRPGSWEVWRQSDESKKSNKKEFSLFDSGVTTIDFVALVPVFSGRIGKTFEARPPLLDMAYLNIAHYQGRSNQQNALTVAQFPILAATGWRPETESMNAAGVPTNTEALALGPRKLLHAEDPQAKFYFVEHTGAAIAAGRSYLQDLQDEINIQGLQLTMPKQSSESITASESNNRQDDMLSELEKIANGFQDALNQALIFTAAWIKSSSPGSIALNGKFNLPRGDADQQTLISMRSAGDITRDTLYAEMQRRGVLSDSFDAKKEKELLSAQAPDIDDFNDSDNADDSDNNGEESDSEAGA